MTPTATIGKTSSDESDLDAIRKSSRAFEEAFNKADAKAVAAQGAVRGADGGVAAFGGVRDLFGDSAARGVGAMAFTLDLLQQFYRGKAPTVFIALQAGLGNLIGLWPESKVSAIGRRGWSRRGEVAGAAVREPDGGVAARGATVGPYGGVAAGFARVSPAGRYT